MSGALSIDGGVARGRFESIDGDITWRGDIDARSTLDFVSHAGVVRLELPATAAAELVISTYQGRIDDRIGAKTERTGSALDEREHRLRVGQPPGGQVTVRTFKGGIVLEPAR